MKRLLVTLTIAFSFITLSSFADEPVSKEAMRSFNDAFKNATEVAWTVNNDYYKASFSFNGQYINAFYNTAGKLIAMTKNISSVQLPLTLQANLRKNYDDCWISDLFEIVDENGITSYYATVENADNKTVLKSSGSTEWNVFQRGRKS